ncbi:hypothetical protein [Marixanthomonas spongiae]|uniref:Right-handed parallel beta-helix repeat-containing protein n=1 Tax=Marixanthomonas spongiae TaxID=2174845 RepID=A0A2U0HXF8_9FLAO|nr:hypothetical protein [Marixanthomonas spongiae]PVW13527.1 hypothetical protein DDV96_12785 [Marixanthomonas spongiae]
MKYVYGLAILACLVLWSSCRNDFESVPSTGNLEFSKDTVYLDTVFSNIGSSTYNLKVYNRSDEDINIPSIQLANGETSNYRLNVDGIPGKSFQDIQVMAEDSIFIFIETTADITTLPTDETTFLYTDQIQFDTGGNQQNVELVTLVQDAVFLFPEQLGDGIVETLNLGTDNDGNDILIEGFFLDDNELTFTNEKPYVIYGYAAVPPQKTLQLEAGARVHFHANSGILVANTGSIKANGAPSNDPELLENEIIFEGDRLEPEFADVPGQWGAIWMTSGSTDNEFSYTTIKNGTVGLLMDNNDGDRTLTLKNVQIYNSANTGLLARTGNVYGENVVINNSGQASLAASLGGTYEFNHCTFANYWNNSFRTFPSVLIDNYFETETGAEAYDLDISFTNCIVYGNESREIALLKDDGGTFNFNFSNSLIRFEDPNGEFDDNPLYDFTNTALYTNSVFNEDPVFQDTELNNFNIETGTSAADGIGKPGVPPNVDLNGAQRDVENPDAGAYESIIFPEER